MKYFKGSVILFGFVAGIIIGLFTDDIVRMALLGIMFGTIGEMAYKKHNTI